MIVLQLFTLKKVDGRKTSVHLHLWKLNEH